MVDFSVEEAEAFDLVTSLQSSLLHLLDTPGPPRSKADGLMNGVRSAALALDKMTIVLDQLKAKVKVLQEGHDKLRSCVGMANNSISSPAYLIPDEVLGMVMSFCMPRQGVDVRHQPTPLVLAAVSRKWRKVVLSLPALWASLYICLHGKDPCLHDVERLHDTINHFLAHSANAHLKLRLQSYWEQRSSIKLIYKTLPLLMQHAHRWEDLSLSVGNAMPAFNECHRLPELRSLYLHASDRLEPLLAFDDVPALRCLVLSQATLCRVVPHLPWAQLTEFTCFDASYDILPILSLTTNLVTLRAEFSPYQYNRILASNIISTPHLRRVSLHQDSPELLNFLQTPSLQHLAVFGRHSGLFEQRNDLRLPRDHGQLQSLLQRSSCSLAELSLTLEIDYAAMLEIAALTPSLTSLRIGSSAESIKVIYDLLCSPTSWPSLHSLFVAYDMYDDLSEEEENVHASALECALRVRSSTLRSISLINYSEALSSALLSFSPSGLVVHLEPILFKRPVDGILPSWSHFPRAFDE